MIKILQVGPYPPPMGGWSFHIKMFKEYLAERGYENQVLNVGASRKDKTLDCIDVQGFFDYVGKHLCFLKQGYVIYNHVDGCSWKGFILTITSQLLSLLFFRKAQLSFHAGTNQHCFKRNRPLYRVLVFITFMLSDKIICNSEVVKKKIVEFGKRADKIYPIPCFSKQYLQFEETYKEGQLEFSNAHSPLLFTYVFFREEFTIEILINAFKKVLENHPEAGLIIVGSTLGSEPVKAMIEQFGISEKVFFADDVTHDNFLSILSKSDLYVRTHLNDGVCSSVLEAVGLGVPVVASYNEMRPEEIITFNGGDGEDLYNKMDYAIANLEDLKRKLKAEAGRDTIEEELMVLLKEKE